MHHKALTEIFLLNVVMPSVESDKLHKEGFIIIIDDFYYC